MNVERDAPTIEQSFIYAHRQRITVLAIWVVIAGAFWWYAYENNVDATALIWRLTGRIAGNRYGAVLYVLAFVLRPLLFIPATMMSIVGGFLFGPIFGFLYAFIGDLTSASLGYLIGRYFGGDLLQSAEEIDFVEKHATRLRENSFITVLILRFLLLPQDLVNYASGFLDVRWISYAAATAVGAFPGVVIYSQFGASLQRPGAGQMQVPSPKILLAPPVLVITSLAFTWYWRRRHAA